MAITAASVTAEPRSWGTGPWKVQVLDFSAASGATGGTATADSLTTAKWAIVTGVVQTAAPTFSGNVVSENDRQVTLRVVGQDAAVIAKSDIQSREATAVSMMPPGLFDHLSDREVIDLVAYLRTVEPVK